MKYVKLFEEHENKKKNIFDDIIVKLTDDFRENSDFYAGILYTNVASIKIADTSIIVEGEVGTSGPTEAFGGGKAFYNGKYKVSFTHKTVKLILISYLLIFKYMMKMKLYMAMMKNLVK